MGESQAKIPVLLDLLSCFLNPDQVKCDYFYRHWLVLFPLVWSFLDPGDLNSCRILAPLYWMPFSVFGWMHHPRIGIGLINFCLVMKTTFEFFFKPWSKGSTRNTNWSFPIFHHFWCRSKVFFFSEVECRSKYSPFHKIENIILWYK